MPTKRRLLVPKFKTEKEEAEWWYANREKVTDEFEEAARRGDLKVLTKERLQELLDASKTRVVTIRLPEADIALARKQAERKGLPYQTYIKSLLHETLIEREGRKAR
jgi:predicted DNA binding CopG/RHH family protein